MRYFIYGVAILLLLPISAFAFFKPSRILLPEAFGVSCNEHRVCVDDPSQFAAAATLSSDSKNYLEVQWGMSVGKPKIIFCSTEKCQSAFGLGKRAGFTVGTLGIVIAPRGWKPYYVAHELIHYWQADNFGNMALLKGKKWFVEGMAYSLSNDPRKRLHEPYESYRQKFNDWHRFNSGIPLKEAAGKEL
ncbi:MAG: hypothetical protein ACYC43_02805 [Burkholderiales bacterium]